jgi:hypothetical protein
MTKQAIATSIVALGLAALLGGGVATASVSVSNTNDSDDIVIIKIVQDRRETDTCHVEVTMRNVQAGRFYRATVPAVDRGSPFDFVLMNGYGDRRGVWFSTSKTTRQFASDLTAEGLTFASTMERTEPPSFPDAWTPGRVSFRNTCTAPF